MRHTAEELGAKMDALGIWDLLVPYNFAVKPRGTVFPYFCTVLKGDGKPVKARFLMLEGWQTLHDFVRTRFDNSFGFYSTPSEMPHIELVVLGAGGCALFRHDPGYAPQQASAPHRALAERIMWEAFGVMLRVEADRELPLKFADERAIFARVEKPDGNWADEPLVIPDPPPHVEKVSFPKDVVKSAKDLPFAADFALAADFRILPGVMTKEPRPRSVYALVAADAATGARVVDLRVSIGADGGLRSLWESMPPNLLREIVRIGKVPGEIKVGNMRMFRMLRPLCMELPFKLSLHEKLDVLP
ncbi:MAG: hypothetical protein J6T51_00680 [Kiritimatiellae bacterium]|nr:hypothetical protein [Kiritimatiellia bacterium]